MIKKAMGGLLVGAFLLGFATLCQADMESENYWISKSVISAGGSFMVSTNYHMGSTLGQPSGIGPSSSSIYAGQSGFWVWILMKGDVNGDGKIDVADLVLSFQILAGMMNLDVHKAADVNADGQIGLAEAVFILGKAAGLR